MRLKSKINSTISLSHSSTHDDAVFYGSLPLVESQSMRRSLLRSEIMFYDMFLSSDLISWSINVSCFSDSEELKMAVNASGFKGVDTL